MKHEIDLSKYSLRTDLAIESLNNDYSTNGIKVSEKEIEDIRITTVMVSRKGSKTIQKKPGKYITIEFQDITDEENRKKVSQVFVRELKKLVRLNSKEDHVLVIGLGNENSTPDALGPKTVNDIVVTNHLYEMGIVDHTFQRVSIFTPSVMGKTGIETSDLISKMIELLKPSLVLVIDSLASTSINRVHKTIQMTDTGIHPGSGVGNKRKEISKEIYGIPVIAIGVPMVVDAVTIVSDTINFLMQHYVYMKKHLNNPKYKLMTNINYLHEKNEISKDDKEKLLGLIGTLNEEETKSLIYDVLTPIGYNFMVTTKEVDFIVDELSALLSKGINKLLHNR